MTAVFVEDGVDKGAIWHFGEPNKEQKALLEGKAWADLSHLQIIAVSGVDRLKWLHDLTTQHLSELSVGQWTSALILDPQGHVEYQFNLVDDGETSWLVLDPGYIETLIAYLQKMKLHSPLFICKLLPPSYSFSFNFFQSKSTKKSFIIYRLTRDVADRNQANQDH